jgi:cytochrome P450
MIDVEIGSRDFIENQHYYLDQLKTNSPIIKTRSGYILVTKYDDIFFGLKNNSFARQIIKGSESHYHALTNMDGKDHSMYRQMLTSTFSNSSINHSTVVFIFHIIYFQQFQLTSQDKQVLLLRKFQF